MKTVPAFAIFLVAVLASSALNAQLLSVTELTGTSQLTRNGLATALNPADPVVDQDRLQIGDGARLTLKLAAHGFIDLGPGADVTVDRLPYASFADDLRTVLRLQKGYLRVVWNHPPAAARWPLFVVMGTHRLQLTNGEFFFESSGAALTACAASGQMVLTDSRGLSTPLPDASCHRLDSGRPQSTTYRAGDWVAIRENFALGAPEAVAAAAPSVAPVVDPDARRPRVQIETVPALQPMAAAPITKPGATGWVINVASLSHESKAERHAEKLRTAGYPARVRAAQVNGRTWYRVQLSGYANRLEANAAADELGAKLGVVDAWASRE